MQERGLIWYAPQSAEKLAKLFAQRPDLERTVRERLDRAYARARELIRVRALLVRMLAQQLLARKVMTGDEVAALIRDAGGANPTSAPSRNINDGLMH